MNWTDVQSLLHNNWMVSVGGITAATLVVYLIVRRSRPSPKKDYPKDTVILYQIGRGPKVPSISPFPLKLETYLRMAKIPYINDHTGKFSSKGKTPWIEYNGVAVADSSFCIEYLNKERGIDLNAHLSAAERAIARAFQKMTEENLYWVLALWRWVFQKPDFNFYFPDMSRVTKFIASLLQYIVMKPMLVKSAKGHGIGRHTKEEVTEIGQKDLKALSDFLGEKPFFMGHQASEVDCAVFGMLAQVYWPEQDSPSGKFMLEELPNLVAFCERMKTTYWPDWEDCILTPGKRGPQFEDFTNKMKTE